MGAYKSNRDLMMEALLNTNMQIQQEAEDIDINEELFQLLLDLKNIENDQNGALRLHKLHDIRAFINRHHLAIDPFYVDDNYDNEFGMYGEERATFFAITEALGNVDENIKNELRTFFMSKLLEKTQEYLREELVAEDQIEEGEKFDDIFVVDKVLRYLGDNELANSIVHRLSFGVYNYAQLQHAWSTYPSALKTLFMSNVMSACARGIDIPSIMALRNHYTPNNWEIFTGEMFLGKLLTDQNLDYLQSQNTISLFMDIINANWPVNYSLHRKLPDLEYFGMITHSKIRTLLEGGFGPLDFFLTLSKEELRGVLVQDNIIAAQNAINDIKVSRMADLLASTVVSNGAASVSVNTAVTMPESAQSHMLWSDKVNNSQSQQQNNGRD